MEIADGKRNPTTEDFKMLVEHSVISILETTAADYKSYKTRYYNLDAIISFDIEFLINSMSSIIRYLPAPHCA